MSTSEVRVAETLSAYRGEADHGRPHGGAEHVVVALAGGPEASTLLARGARLAARSRGSLDAVHISRPGHDGDLAPTDLATLRVLAADAGGSLHIVVADEAAEAVLDFARGVHATTLVVGVSRRTRWAGPFRTGVSDRIIAASGDIDVLMITHPYAHATPLSRRYGANQPLGRTRLVTGWALALLAPSLLTALMLPLGGSRTPAFEALAFIAATVLCALVGGLLPALTAALFSSLLLNFFFTPPLRTFSIANVEDVIAVLLFLVVALSVASVVGAAARRAVQATQARREADTLSLLNETLLRGEHDMAALLKLVCDTFGMAAAAMLSRVADPGERHETWDVVASHGPDPPGSPDAGDASAEASAHTRLVLRGHPLPAYDMRVLTAFATHLAVVADRERLAAQTAAAARLEEGNQLRTALLAAVSHDLRTPLAGIKAAVSTLRTPGITWSSQDQADLLASIEESVDRLGAIIENLLDMSRLQTGAVHLALQEVGLEDVVARSVRALQGADRIHLDVAADLPAVSVDVGLLDRVTANLVENALRYSPSATRVEVTAEARGRQVRLRVIDHGPGVAKADKGRLFQPFQRLGDVPAGEGVGLGLAVAEGLTRAMGGCLTAQDTVGGGLTMVLDLPTAEASDSGGTVPDRPEIVAGEPLASGKP